MLITPVLGRCYYYDRYTQMRKLRLRVCSELAWSHVASGGQGRSLNASRLGGAYTITTVRSCPSFSEVTASLDFQLNVYKNDQAISECLRGSAGCVSKSWFQLRSWSHGRGTELRVRLCANSLAFSLPHILCVPLFLPLPHSCSLSSSLKNKH